MKSKREIKQVACWGMDAPEDVIFEMTNGWFYYVMEDKPGEIFAMDTLEWLLTFNPYFTDEGEIPADKLEAAKRAVLTGRITEVKSLNGKHPEK